MNLHDPFATGVLVPERHGRLVADIDNAARDASIQPAWIWTSLTKTVSEQEIDWVRTFKKHSLNGKSGLCYVGKDPFPSVEDRMAAIAGALVRNFVRARVCTLNAFVDASQEGDVPDMSCVLIPNFFMGKKSGGDLPPWKVAILLDAMLYRHVHHLQTVLYVSDMDAIGLEYGLAFQKHIQAQYQIIEV